MCQICLAIGLKGISKDLKPLVLLGTATTCWPIWLRRNDIVFENKKYSSPFIGCLLGHLLASYVSYPLEAGYTGFGCGVFAVLAHVAKVIFSQAHE